MDVLGRTGEERYADFLIKMTSEEFRTITGINETHPRVVPTKVAVCDAWRKGMDVLRAVEDAVKVPNALRSVADCLDMVMPAVALVRTGKPLDAKSEGAE